MILNLAVEPLVPSVLSAAGTAGHGNTAANKQFTQEQDKSDSYLQDHSLLLYPLWYILS